jgi:poly(ADP-ribose) glycohydrolase ARH3
LPDKGKKRKAAVEPLKRRKGAPMELKAKFLGSMVGSALGDAIGEMAFHLRTREALVEAVDRAEVLSYTDDTAMAIGLAESLLRMSRVDQDDLGRTFERNYLREPWRGYASGPPTVFAMVNRLGISYTEAARRLFGGSGSLGNGAAMRVGPVGLFFHDSGELYAQACASAEVTHAHPVGKDGAAVQALAVGKALRLDPTSGFSGVRFAMELASLARTREIKGKMEAVARLLEGGIGPAEAARTLGKGVAVDESMPFAIYSFLRHPHSFVECLLCAVLNGGDRDTLGAMACAISGAYLGVEGIPLEWARKLENRSIIEDLGMRLLEIRCPGNRSPWGLG